MSAAESVAAKADSMSGHITLMALRWLLGTTSRMLKPSAGISQANSVESPSPAFLVAGCARDAWLGADDRDRPQPEGSDRSNPRDDHVVKRHGPKILPAVGYFLLIRSATKSAISRACSRFSRGSTCDR